MRVFIDETRLLEHNGKTLPETTYNKSKYGN